MTLAGPLLAEDHDRPYEYRTYAVGDRVICKPSPECRTKFRGIAKSTGRVIAFYAGHDVEQCGRTGTVSGWPPGFLGGRGSHPYRVVFDKPYVGENGHRQNSAPFASSELESLDPEATR